ncbi:hypothetical protein NHX12_003994 [Muraenolepis orangiensis]|uniref:Zonadhesin n=1 Tax=Muraenolepis orangiensis TaxID=630683 RepID=A0A9Q0IBS0_9TELE|nr:hypothetical protein NHX12_003994 [Muraenolepis orangiensis]
MQGGYHTHLWVTLSLLLLTQVHCKVPCGNSSLTLPSWRTNSEYLTQCVLTSDSGPSCDWTAAQTAAGDVYLESKALGLEVEACLEFWYQSAAVVSEGSELRVGLKENTQGIRSGQCGRQCEPNTDLWTDESTRCVCSGDQLLSCFSPLCPGSQASHRPSEGSARGVAARGTCTVHTDPQCSTFDGALFRFMAPCTYILAQTCSPTTGLPMFSVEVVSEPSGNNVSESAVQRVNVEVNNVRLSLLKRETQRVMVNGVWQTLPLTLNGAKVNIRSNPAVVTVETDEKVLVSYDNAGAVHVKLPALYAGKVCGMCGNFNSLMEDDNRRPDGSESPDATDLARSWQTGEHTAPCDTILVPHMCDPLQEDSYRSLEFCGELLSSTGPFSRCLSILGVESYYRSCVAGMCAAHGDLAIMCRTLQSYADICYDAGVAVPSWRNATMCPLECGANSHYDACAEGCQEVCSGMDLAGACGSCEERCVCDPGFKLSGGTCVLADDCGCWSNGRHYEKGVVFMDEGCTQRCQCLGNGQSRCSPWSCADNEICKDRDRVKGCFPPETVTCSVYGDPHYITYDKRAYNFQGGCNYTLATTCGAQTPVRFTVTGRNVNPTDQNLTRSKLDTVVIQIQELHLTLHQNGNVYVNNKLELLPYYSIGSYGSLKVHRQGRHVVAESDVGLKVMIDGQNRLFLQVDERYKGEMCGLCGTYSGWQADDFLKPDGSNATGSFDFGNSWRVMEDSSLCTATPDDPKICDQHGEELAYGNCSVLLGDAFSPCHEPVHPVTYISSCVYDHCATSGDLHTLCDSLESYAAACHVAGVQLPDWKNNTACADTPNTTPPPTTTPLPTAPTPDQTICPLNCNFDSHMCGWQQLIQDSFDWTRQHGSTNSSSTGPNGDHTTGEGYYMYIEADGMTHGDSARLLSAQCNYRGPLCLQFWYHMYGSATAMALNIYQLHMINSQKVWSMANNQGPEWRPAFVDMQVSGSFKIILEAVRGSNAQSDVAIDDISIHYGSCQNGSPVLVGGSSSVPPISGESFLSHPVCSLDCSFNGNLCGWSQAMTDAFDWTLEHGSTPTLMTGPSADHTGDGHYLYIEANSATYGDTARLHSSECSQTGPQCLRFWYHMYGSADTMGLHVYLLQDRVADAVWWKTNNQGNVWHEAMVDFTPTGPFQIIVEGRRGSNERSDVAIDDDTHPVCKMNCDFEQDLCEWNQLVTDVFDWTRHNGSTPTIMTGPSSDHTAGDGHYLYIEANSATYGDTARLLSSECSHTGPQCLQFWYHMYGSADTMGLHVYLLQDRLADAVLWKRNDQGDVWHEAMLDLTTVGPFQIIFEGRRGSNDQSDVAIDDVSLHSGHCADGHYLYIEANSAAYGDTARLLSSECSHTGPQCLQFWYHMYGSADTMGLHVYLLQDRLADAVLWKRNDQGDVWHEAMLDLTTVGPFQIIFEGRRGSNDQSDVAIDDVSLHSGHCAAGDGHYLYIEANSAAYGDTARLLSSECSHTGPQCLQFWYHMYGSADTMGLHVYLLQDRLADAVLWKRNDQGDVWHEAMLDLTTVGPFQIIFEGRRGSNDQSDVAIDDVSLHSGHCADLVNKTTTSNNRTIANFSQTTTFHNRKVANYSKTTTSYHRKVANYSKTTTSNHRTVAKYRKTSTSYHRKVANYSETTTSNHRSVANYSKTSTSNHRKVANYSETTTSNHRSVANYSKTSTYNHRIVANYSKTSTSNHRKVANYSETTTSNHRSVANYSKTSTSNHRKVANYSKTTTSNHRMVANYSKTSTSNHRKVANYSKTSTSNHRKVANYSETTTSNHRSIANYSKTSTSNHRKVANYSETTTSNHRMVANYSKTSTSNHRKPILPTTERPQQSTTLTPTPSCPENSHYTPCMPPCQPTCIHLHGPPDCSVDEPCVQGCACDAGFVLQRRVCVPIQRCGCVDRNGSVHYFKDEWYTAHCRQKCECEEDRGTGKIDCDDEECDGVCLEDAEGQYNCHPTDFSECTIKRHPEYRTFDGLKHKFRGEHSYVLVQTTGQSRTRPGFYVEGINAQEADDSSDHRGDDKLKIRVYNHTVEFKRNRRLVVDGRVSHPPVSPSGGISITQHSFRLYLKTDFGLSVEFDGHSQAMIILPYIYRRKVGGLCGHFDGRKNNDLMKPDGRQAKDVQQFGQSWRVSEDSLRVRRR